MLKSGPAKKVAVYVGEAQQYHGQAVYSAILDFLFYRGVSGATITRSMAGFGADHHLHTTKLVDLSANLPVKVEFIESPERVEELLPKLQEMAGTGLIEIQDTTVIKPATTAKQRATENLPALKAEGKAMLMRIYFGENDKWHGKPLHQALLEAMRANDLAGATVYRGILGYGANRRIHEDRALSLSHDRPIMMSVIDKEEKLRAFTPILDQMIQQGLVAISEVEVVTYAHNYRQSDRRQEPRS